MSALPEQVERANMQIKTTLSTRTIANNTAKIDRDDSMYLGVWLRFEVSFVVFEKVLLRDLSCDSAFASEQLPEGIQLDGSSLLANDPEELVGLGPVFIRGIQVWARGGRVEFAS